MSCHLSKYAFIVNLRAIKNSLTFEDDIQGDDYSAEAWNSGWEIEDTNEEKLQEPGRQKFEDQPWLQECITSLSPTIDVLALAHRQYVVFLTSKWDVNEESNTKLKFGTSFEGKLPGCGRNENITSLLCLPLASQKRSLQGGPDWTCITVGFSSGYVRIYTEKGELLLSQLLHEEPVGHLRCKTHVPQHYANYSEQPEELVIVYSTVVVTIDGFGLFQTLRACRNQLARLTAGRQESAQPPPLSYKKWGFQEHDRLMDCEAAGSLSISAFDHLVTESIRKGFYGSAKASIPSNSLLITTGSNPYAGFYYATEGNSQLFLSDIVHAAANKLINFLTHSNAGGFLGLIGRGEQEEQKNKPKIEPATVLPLRFGLYDKRRQGISITLSPNKSLATITDAFGRVILFDVQRGIAVRIWKGYRDAQCGWVEVEDAIHAKDSFSSSACKRKHAFFLVIYAPRRGILEVWCAQQGPRAAAFNVGRSGRLLFPGYTMVGANYAASGLSRHHLSACYFLDPDGTLKKIVVPFHAILSERNSKRARDLHLLKELRITLKNKAEDKSKEIVKILKDMRTSSVRIQALDSIFNSRHATVDLVEGVTSALLEHLLKQDPEKTDHEMKLLKQSCIRAQQLVKLYRSVDEINNKTNPGTSSESSVDIQLYSTSLCISETEIGRILSLVTLHQSVVPVSKKHVRFQDDVVTDMPFCDFMSCFTLNDSHLVKSGEEILAENLPVMLVNGISEKQIESLGGFLFNTCINVGSSLSSLHAALKDSGIHPNKLLLLLLHHWVSDIGFCSDADKWLNLQQVMKHISSLTDPKIVSSDSEHVSPWWEAVREILIQSTSNLAAYVGAVVARSVSVVMAASFNVEQKSSTGAHKNGDEEKNTDEKAESGDSDWEAVSLDLEHWNLLLKQLEDMLLLSMLLKSQPYGKTTVKDTTLSVSSVISGGPGVITDLVAVWAVSVGLDPGILSKFVTNDGSENNSASISQTSDSDSSDQQTAIFVKGLIFEVKKRFPCSLNHDALLANCCWENMMLWSKNKDVVIYLNQALSCLLLVSSSAVKNGFASMVWKGCVQKRFEALSFLVDKVGKMPKERLCRKELEMSDNCLESFLDFCCQILTIISETSRALEIEDVPKFTCEYLWQDRENVGPAPLIVMALGQRVSANYLIYQHMQLSVVLEMVVTFQLKSVKPLSLFSDNARKNFFRELHYKFSSPDDKKDSGLQSLRMQFLMKVVVAIAQGAPENVPDSTPVPKSSGSSDQVVNDLNEKPQGTTSLAGQRLASKWFGRVLELGHEWGLNMDELRRHYVCELYSGGQDYLAQEIMPSVSDLVFLGSQLLLLAGQRVHNIIYNSPDPASKLACLPPDLSKWLKSLGGVTLRCNSVPLGVTASLIDHILAFLDDGLREKALAQSLRDAVSRLLLISESAHS